MNETQAEIDVFSGVNIDSETVNPGRFVNGKVVEEYQVTEHASITIIHDEERNEYLYRVNEPELDNFETLIRAELSKKIIDALKYENTSEYEEEDMADIVRRNAETILTRYIRPGSKLMHAIRSALPKIQPNRVLDDDAMERVMYYIVRDFVHYGKITAIMNDPNIEDVSCNAPNTPVFVYHAEYDDMMTNVAYEPNELDSFIRTLAQGSGKHISIADPMVDGSLKDGSRVQLTLSDEVTGDGSNFTIRKFEDIPFTPVDLIEFGTFSLDQMAYLWLAIENNKSLIFAGGTASGKTTSMNAISLFVPPGSKTITIEDTREIQLRHNNWIKSMTRDSFGGTDDAGEVDMFDLLKAALRQRPEYIIVGEIRGEEAQTLFQAMSTGHTTYSTMHADSVDGAIHRLENPPIDVPRPMLKALDILCVQNQTFVDDERVRRNESIVEITGIDNRTQRINTKEVYEWDAESDEFPQTGDSAILEDIQKQRAWSVEELNRQIDMRRNVLKYLIDNDITDYRAVTDIIRAFILDNETITEKIKDGTLEQYATKHFDSADLIEEAVEESEDGDHDDVYGGDDFDSEALVEDATSDTVELAPFDEENTGDIEGVTIKEEANTGEEDTDAAVESADSVADEDDIVDSAANEGVQGDDHTETHNTGGTKSDTNE